MAKLSVKISCLLTVVLLGTVPVWGDSSPEVFSIVPASQSLLSSSSYNTVFFGSDHATEFTCGLGHLSFDGFGNYTGEISEVSQGQSTGGAFEIGTVSGEYSVDSNGSLSLGDYDNGFVSADGSLIIWAPVPGDTPYEEAGINVGVKQGAGLGVASLNGIYNAVFFGSDHATEFTCGLGHLSFDGFGNYTGEISEVSQGQSTGGAFEIGTVSGEYSVDSNGSLSLGDYDNGFVSADGSLIIWAPVPGDTPYEEAGINVGVKQGVGLGVASLKGIYNAVLFGSDHATEFTCGLGHLSFDGFGNYTGEISEVSQGQSTGEAFEIGTVSGEYSVDSNGSLSFGDYDNGFVSADGSLIIWAPVPGDTPYEEAGINVGVRVEPAVGSTDEISIIITKCLLKADKIRSDLISDSFVISGEIPSNGLGVINDFSNNLTDIIVSVINTDITDSYGYTELLDSDKIDVDDKKRNIKYKNRFNRGEDGGVTSFNANLIKGNFSITAKGVDLSGLSSPITVEIKIGYFLGSAVVYDGEAMGSGGDLDVINGKKPIPMPLLLGYDDALRVDKCKLTLGKGKKVGKDYLLVQGAISVADTTVGLNEKNVIVTWGNDGYFTIPIGKLTAKKGAKYICKKYQDSEGWTIDATIDLDKCSFKIIIKNANIGSQDNPVDFGVQFGDFGEDIALQLTKKNPNLFVYP